MKHLLIGWLKTKGVTLANDASDLSVLKATQKAFTDDAAPVESLANEKETLRGEKIIFQERITALENEKSAAATALANEQTARKVERKARAEAIVDLAITKGKLKPADRTAKIDLLANTADDAAFKTTSDGLLNGANIVKTIGGDSARSGKVLANDGTDPGADVDPRDAFMEAVKKHMNDTKETDLGKAMKAVKTQCPQLYQELIGRNPENGKEKS